MKTLKNYIEETELWIISGYVHKSCDTASITGLDNVTFTGRVAGSTYICHKFLSEGAVI